MASRVSRPPIVDAGFPSAVPVGKIDAGIGKAAACYVRYKAMIEADLAQAILLVRATVTVSQAAIDAWNVAELAKVQQLYGRCAACIDDWVRGKYWLAITEASKLVPPATAAPKDPTIPPAITTPPAGPICYSLTAVTASNLAWITGSGGLAGGGPPDYCQTADHWRLAGPFATQSLAQAAAATIQVGAQGYYYFSQTWSYPASSDWWLVASYRQCMPCGVGPPPPGGGPCLPVTVGPPGTHWDTVVCAWVQDTCPAPLVPCPAGQHWDTTLCLCVADIVVPPPTTADCCLPGQRVTIHSDNTWSIEGDLKDFPTIQALLAGVLKVIERDDPPQEAAEWDWDVGPPTADPDLSEITYIEVGDLGSA